jgi:hypothetical protein
MRYAIIGFGKTVVDVTAAYGVPLRNWGDSLLPRSSRRPSQVTTG